MRRAKRHATCHAGLEVLGGWRVAPDRPQTRRCALGPCGTGAIPAGATAFRPGLCCRCAATRRPTRGPTRQGGVLTCPEQGQTAFTSTGWVIFQALMLGWVLCPGRKTITGIYRMADPARERTHDAYHRFVRCGAWSVDVLWQTLAQAMVASLVQIEIDLDDTLLHKSGRRVDGAGWWRDAVRSTGSQRSLPSVSTSSGCWR